MDIQDESRLGVILVRTLSTPEHVLERALATQAAGDARDIGTILEDDHELSGEDLAAALELQRRMRGDDVSGALQDVVRIAYERAARVLVDDEVELDAR